MAMRRQMPCPYRIIDDLGGAFAMGCLGGSIFHFLKGAWRSPKSTRFSGGIKQLAKRAPILGGGFAQWGGLFTCTDCVLTYVRGKQDATNQIVSGFITGGLLAIRAGPRIAFRNAITGGVLLGAIVLVEIVMNKTSKAQELQYTSQMHQSQMKSQRIKASQIRPDLFTSDGRVILRKI